MILAFAIVTLVLVTGPLGYYKRPYGTKTFGLKVKANFDFSETGNLVYVLYRKAKYFRSNVT